MPISIDPLVVTIITQYLDLQQEAADDRAGSVRADVVSSGRDLGPAQEEVIEARQDYWSSEAAAWGSTSTAWRLANS